MNRATIDQRIETCASPESVTALIAQLRSAHAAVNVPSDEIIRLLAEAASRWRESQYERRRQAVDHAAALTGQSRAMIDDGFDQQFSEYTMEQLTRFLDEAGHRRGGPAVSLLIPAGNVPGLAIPDLAALLLAGSACLVRPSSNDPLTPSLFAETLIELEPRLARLIAVAWWPRDHAAITTAAAGAVDCVIASGDDDTVRTLERDGRVIGFGHRRSAALIGAERLTEAGHLAAALARDICFYEQQGCLSPHVVYVEEDGAAAPIEFARHLAKALGQMAAQWPPAPIPLEAAGLIQQLQAELEFQEATGVHAWSDAAGTVLYDSDPAPRFSPGWRTIWVKPVPRLERAIDLLGAWSGRIESVGLALSESRMDAIGLRLDRLSPGRRCQIGSMQQPPLRWRWLDQQSNSRGLLPQLLTWTSKTF